MITEITKVQPNNIKGKFKANKKRKELKQICTNEGIDYLELKDGI